jgi:hypothetical protein
MVKNKYNKGFYIFYGGCVNCNVHSFHQPTDQNGIKTPSNTKEECFEIVETQHAATGCTQPNLQIVVLPIWTQAID